MENGNSDETKANAEAEEAKPSKPSLIEKLKNKRWTFKIKNNFSKYVTVEPLICFYMIQIFVESSLIRPYMFHKACVEINEDTYFCDIMTSNWHIDDKLCATYELYGTLFCKRQDDLHFDDIDEPLECDVITRMYSESNTSAIQVTPEHYRFCRLGQKVLEKMYTSYSLIGISALILHFLVSMIVSIWSDKYSKRKMCLMLPIFGQLVTSIINLHGVYSNFLSLEFIFSSYILITALTGGMSLFLFGCFSYMVHEAVRRKLLFRFGVISLILIVFRQIPHLTDAVHKFYHRSYQNSFILNLVFSIICLLYIKIILNESKRQVDVNALKNESASLKSEPQSTRDGRSSVNRRKSKIQHLVKVFSLDVIWDYILIVFKKRRHNGRAVILTFLIVAFLCRMSLFGLLNHIEMRKDFPFAFMDVDGAIFVIFSILLVTFNTSEAVISILVIVIPPLMRLILTCLGLAVPGPYVTEEADFYYSFKQIASSCFLLAYVDKNESRIFLITQLIAHLPKTSLAIVASLFEIFDAKSSDVTIAVLVCLALATTLFIFCGLGVLCCLHKKHKRLTAEPLPEDIEDITQCAGNFNKPENSEPKKEGEGHLLEMATQFPNENENSTDL